MKAPNFKVCTEEELWKYVSFYLAKVGIEAVLVGGAVVAIYSKGVYRSGDLDFIIENKWKEGTDRVLISLGFEKIRGRHYEHPECSHLIIEFPPGPVSIGDDYRIVPDEIEVEGQKLKLFSPTDCIRDRLASFIHFKSRDCLEQAVLVAKTQPFNINKVKDWCKSEGASEEYREFMGRLKDVFQS